MKVQQLNRYNHNVNRPLNNRVNSKQNPKSISFKGYESALKEIISKKFANTREVQDAYRKVYGELSNSPHLEKGRFYKTLFLECLSCLEPTIDTLRTPLTEMPPKFRNIVIDTAKVADEPILTISKNKGLYIENHGKIGFWNSVFNSQDAKNDILVVLRDGYDNEFKVSKLKHGQLKVQQRSGNYLTESIFNVFSLSSRKTIDMGEPHIPVGP